MYDKSIGFMCAKLAFTLRKNMQKTVSESTWGLSDEREIGILFIANKQEVSQIEIAHILEVDKNTVRTFIDDLENLGLVIRQKNPNNRKENLILLTDKGKKVIGEIFDVVIEYEREFLLMFSDEEIETLGTLLRKFFHSLDEKDSQKTTKCVHL